MAGIGNAVAVLANLQRICKRLLMPEVQRLLLFWKFATDLLEMVPILMDFREPSKRGFLVFIRNWKYMCMYFVNILIQR